MATPYNHRKFNGSGRSWRLLTEQRRAISCNSWPEAPRCQSRAFKAYRAWTGQKTSRSAVSSPMIRWGYLRVTHASTSSTCQSTHPKRYYKRGWCGQSRRPPDSDLLDQNDAKHLLMNAMIICTNSQWKQYGKSKYSWFYFDKYELLTI